MAERRANDATEAERCADGANRPNSFKQRAADGHLKSRVVKRSLVVGGHKTSVSLEDVFWNELRAIANRRGLHLSQLVGSIDSERQHGNLSSALRLFVFEESRHHPVDEHSPNQSIQPSQQVDQEPAAEKAVRVLRPA